MRCAGETASYGQRGNLHKRLLQRLLTEASTEVVPANVTAATLVLTAHASPSFAMARVNWANAARDLTSEQLQSLTTGMAVCCCISRLAVTLKYQQVSI